MIPIQAWLLSAPTAEPGSPPWRYGKRDSLLVDRQPQTERGGLAAERTGGACGVLPQRAALDSRQCDRDGHQAKAGQWLTDRFAQRKSKPGRTAVHQNITSAYLYSHHANALVTTRRAVTLKESRGKHPTSLTQLTFKTMTELNAQDHIIELTDEQVESIEGGIYIPDDEPLRKLFYNIFFPALLSA